MKKPNRFLTLVLALFLVIGGMPSDGLSTIADTFGDVFTVEASAAPNSVAGVVEIWTEAHWTHFALSSLMGSSSPYAEKEVHLMADITLGASNPYLDPEFMAMVEEGTYPGDYNVNNYTTAFHGNIDDPLKASGEGLVLPVRYFDGIFNGNGHTITLADGATFHYFSNQADKLTNFTHTGQALFGTVRYASVQNLVVEMEGDVYADDMSRLYTDGTPMFYVDFYSSGNYEYLKAKRTDENDLFESTTNVYYSDSEMSSTGFYPKDKSTSHGAYSSSVGLVAGNLIGSRLQSLAIIGNENGESTFYIQRPEPFANGGHGYSYNNVYFNNQYLSSAMDAQFYGGLVGSATVGSNFIEDSAVIDFNLATAVNNDAGRGVAVYVSPVYGGAPLMRSVLVNEITYTMEIEDIMVEGGSTISAVSDRSIEPLNGYYTDSTLYNEGLYIGGIVGGANYRSPTSQMMESTLGYTFREQAIATLDYTVLRNHEIIGRLDSSLSSYYNFSPGRGFPYTSSHGGTYISSDTISVLSGLPDEVQEPFARLDYEQKRVLGVDNDYFYHRGNTINGTEIYYPKHDDVLDYGFLQSYVNKSYSAFSYTQDPTTYTLDWLLQGNATIEVTPTSDGDYEYDIITTPPLPGVTRDIPWELEVEAPLKGQVASPQSAAFNTTVKDNPTPPKKLDTITISESANHTNGLYHYGVIGTNYVAAANSTPTYRVAANVTTTNIGEEDVTVNWTVTPENAVVFTNPVTKSTENFATNFTIPSNVSGNIVITATATVDGGASTPIEKTFTITNPAAPNAKILPAANPHTVQTTNIAGTSTAFKGVKIATDTFIEVPLTATVAGDTPIDQTASWEEKTGAGNNTTGQTVEVINENILKIPYVAAIAGKKVVVTATYGGKTSDLTVTIPTAAKLLELVADGTASTAHLNGDSANQGFDTTGLETPLDVNSDMIDTDLVGTFVNDEDIDKIITHKLALPVSSEVEWHYAVNTSATPPTSFEKYTDAFDVTAAVNNANATADKLLYVHAFARSLNNSQTYADSETVTFQVPIADLTALITTTTTTVDFPTGNGEVEPRKEDPLFPDRTPYTATITGAGDVSDISLLGKIDANPNPKEFATGEVILILTSEDTSYLGDRVYGKREPQVYVRYDINGIIPPPVISPASDSLLFAGNTFTISRPQGFSLGVGDTYTISYTMKFTKFDGTTVDVAGTPFTLASHTLEFGEDQYKQVEITAIGTFETNGEDKESAAATVTYTVENLTDFGLPTLTIVSQDEAGNSVETEYRNDLQVTQQFNFKLAFPEDGASIANGSIFYMLNPASAPSFSDLSALKDATTFNPGSGKITASDLTTLKEYTIASGNRVYLSAVYYDAGLDKYSPVAEFELSVAPKPDAPSVLEDGRLLNGGLRNTYSIGEHSVVMLTLPEDFIDDNPLYTMFEYSGEILDGDNVDVFETHKIESGTEGEYIKESDVEAIPGYVNGAFEFYPATSLLIGNTKPGDESIQTREVIAEIGEPEAGHEYVSYIHDSLSIPSLPEIRVGEVESSGFVTGETMGYNTRLIARTVYEGYIDDDFDADNKLKADATPREFVTYVVTYEMGDELKISIREPLTETTIAAITYVSHSNVSDPLEYTFTIRDQIKPVVSLPETTASTTASISAGSLVILSTETPGSTIFYTDDGTEVFEPVRDFTGAFMTTQSAISGERDLYLFVDPSDPNNYLVENSVECSTKWYDPDSSSLTAPLSSNTIFTIRAKAYSPLDTLKESVESVLRFLITPLPPADKPVLMGEETSFKLGDSVRFNPPPAGLEIFYALNNQAPVVNEMFLEAYSAYETEPDGLMGGLPWATWVLDYWDNKDSYTEAQRITLSENKTLKYNSETGIIMTPDNTTGVLTMVVNAVSYDTRAFPLYSQSENAQFVFTLTQMAAPSSIPATTAEEIATISPGAKISLTSSMSNFKIYYTLDGSSVSVPSTWGGALTGSTQLYDQTTGITMPHGDTFLVVRAIAVYLDESDPSTFRTTFADSTEVQLLFQPPAPVQAVMATPVGLKDNPPNLVQDTEVVLSTSTDDATIYYKAFASSGDYDDVWNTVSSGVENIDPSTFDIYNPESPLVISTETWIVTFAELSGVISAPTSYHYRVADQLAPPTSSHATGSVVPKGGRISLTSAGGGDIIYTLDGTDPADAEAGEDSTAMYGNNVVLNGEYGASVVVRAYAVRDGYTPSETVSFTYTILEEGSYITTSPQVDSVVRIGSNITLFTAMSGAEIYYTTNGSDPIVTITPGVNGAAATVVAGAGTMKGSTVQVTGEPGGTFIIKAKPVVAGLGDSAVSLLSYNIAEMAAAPTSSIPSGATTYFGARATLSSAEGSIHYTTNGDTPTNSSATYSSPIEITGSMVLKAITVVDGKENSEIASYIYNRAGQVSTPYTTTANGEIALGTRIELHCATEGASIYYSTNGTEPTADKLSDMFLYTEPITVRRPVTLKFFAIKNGMDVSGSNSAVYTVIEPPPPVVETDDGDLGITTTDKLVRRDAVEVAGPSFTDIVAKDTVTSIILTADEPVLEKDVAIVVNEIVPTESDKDVVEGTRAMEIARLYDINVELYGESVQPNGESEIGIPIPPEYVNAIVTIVRINDDGTVDAFLTRRDGNMAYAKVTHFSKYALAVPMGTVGTGLDDSGSSTVLIIAIVAIMIVALALIAVVVYMLWRKKKKEQQAATAEGTLQSGRYNPMYHIPTQNRGYTPTPGQNLTPLSPPSPPASLMTNNTTQQGSETEEETESSKQ